MLETAVFDMDGVIVDSHPAHRKAWRRLLESAGRSVSEAELDFVLDGHTRVDILRHFWGDLPETMLRDLGLRKQKFFAECSGEVGLVDGVADFIIRLEEAGVQLAVATSASRSRAEDLLARFGLRQHFAAVVTGDDVQLGKPHPEVFQRACERLQGDPKTTLVVEDAVSGVKGSKAAGMRCMGVADASRAHLLYQAGAQYVVPNFLNLDVKEVFSHFE